MNDYVADTHALYWYLTRDPRLGTQAQAVFEQAASGNAKIWVSSIVLAEMFYLLDKQGRSFLFGELFEKLEQAEQFTFIDFVAEDTLQFSHFLAIPEMHDRIIVASAAKLAAVCLTKDEKIIASGLVNTRW
ncbi:PIN domain-containing protein [bacterium]|nr:PIN domain-containing protein [bacterium]NUM78584.1 PIN domain-containing protein [candidate division KSB1 bacterium]